jgi:Kef-type K+ transport system membrane component KefB
MHDQSILFVIFIIFSGSAIAATLALAARQAFLVSYILLGVLLGPSGFKVVNDAELIKGISEIGIIFLLYLLGLNLHPQKLLHSMKATTLLTLGSSTIFGALGLGCGYLVGLNWSESLILGAALMFSSTIIGLKLLPTTVLHHQHTGEIVISVLLMQDFIAIVVLLLLQAGGEQGLPIVEFSLLFVAVAGLSAGAYYLAKYVVLKLVEKYDTIHEYVFLLAIGWCLAVAEAATMVGLSHEIGAFIAGVALATSPIAYFISESLKPLRDFFLVLFFFSLGAGFDLAALQSVFIPALLVAGVVMLAKPLVFRQILIWEGEQPTRSLEIGVRLGQISEFSLLIAVLALDLAVIGERASYLIQLATLFTFVLSSYWIVLRYPTPVAVSDKLRRN